jgi:hypothetical protein
MVFNATFNNISVISRRTGLFVEETGGTGEKKRKSLTNWITINKQDIDNSECFGVKSVKIYPEMISQYFFEKIWFWLII